MKDKGTNNEVDKYIMNQPKEVQNALQMVRSYIKVAAPDSIEMMNYNIPAFSLIEGGKRDQQIMIAGYKKHVGFYPHPSTIEKFSNELKEINPYLSQVLIIFQSEKSYQSLCLRAY